MECVEYNTRDGLIGWCRVRKARHQYLFIFQPFGECLIRGIKNRIIPDKPDLGALWPSGYQLLDALLQALSAVAVQVCGVDEGI